MRACEQASSPTSLAREQVTNNKMKNIIYFIFLLLISVAYSPGAHAASLISIQTSSGQETITLSVPDISSHKVFTVESPDRLVVDVTSLPSKPHPSLPSSYKGSLIKNIRYGQFTP